MLKIKTLLEAPRWAVVHVNAINERVLCEVDSQRLARKCVKGLNSRTDTEEFNHYCYWPVPAAWVTVLA